MHILHVIATLDPAAGEPSESVRALLNCAPPGYSSEVVTQDDPDAPFVHSLPCRVHALGPRKSAFGRNRRLLGWLRENWHRFDGVILNGIWTYEAIAVRKVCANRRPYIVAVHGMLDSQLKRPSSLAFAGRRVYWLLAEQRNLPLAHRVLFTSSAEASLAARAFHPNRWKQAVISSGAHRPQHDGPALQSAFYWKFPEMRDRRFMLFLGQIQPSKGCDLLIHAFVKHAADDPELHLMVAGSDPLGSASQLKQIVAKAGLIHRIHWPGMLQDDVKWGAFYASEVFILPAHQENFGSAVAEAISCGLPALLSEKVPIAPDIAAARAAFIEPDTQQGTDSLIRRWIETQPAERGAMSIRAQELFEQRYDPGKCSAAIFHLFDQPTSTNSN